MAYRCDLCHASLHGVLHPVSVLVCDACSGIDLVPLARLEVISPETASWLADLRARHPLAEWPEPAQPSAEFWAWRERWDAALAFCAWVRGVAKMEPTRIGVLE